MMGHYDSCVVHSPCTIIDALERLPGTTIEDLNTFIQEGELQLFARVSSKSFIKCERYFKRDMWGHLSVKDEEYIFDSKEIDSLFVLLYSIKDIPYRNNSMWIGLNDLSNRWKVDKEDILARLRSGELYSNRYDNFSNNNINPTMLYPIGSECEISCHFGNHIWPYENKHPTLKRSAINQYNLHASYDGLPEIDLNSRHTKNSVEFVPAESARKQINKSPGQFVDILDKGEIETDVEEKRRKEYAEWEIRQAPLIDDLKHPFRFFKIQDIQEITVNSISLESYMENHGIPTLRVDNNDMSEDDNHFKALAAELEDKNAELQAKIADLEAAIAVQSPTDQNDKPKTAPATEAAQASRVEEWKRYAVVMAKIAYDCGLEDRKQVTRSEYMTLAKRHGELSKQALELLRNALPEGVTNTSGGASKQG